MRLFGAKFHAIFLDIAIEMSFRLSATAFSFFQGKTHCTEVGFKRYKRLNRKGKEKKGGRRITNEFESILFVFFL